MECLFSLQCAKDATQIEQDVQNSYVIIQQIHKQSLSEIALTVKELLNSSAQIELLLTDIFPIELNLICQYGTHKLTFTNTEEQTIEIMEFVFKLQIIPLPEYNLHQFICDNRDLQCMQECIIDEEQQNDVFNCDKMQVTMLFDNKDKKQYISVPNKQLLLLYSQQNVICNEKVFLSIPIHDLCLISLSTITNDVEMQINNNIENTVLLLQKQQNDYYQYYSQHFCEIKEVLLTQQPESDNHIKQSGIYKCNNYKTYQHIGLQQIRTEQVPIDDFIRSALYAEQPMEQPDVAYMSIQHTDQQAFICQTHDNVQTVQNSISARIQFIDTNLNNDKFMNIQFTKYQNNEIVIQLQKTQDMENIPDVQYIAIPIIQLLNQDVIILIHEQIYIRLYVFNQLLSQLKNTNQTSIVQLNSLLHLKYIKYIQLKLIISLYKQLQQIKCIDNSTVSSQKTKQNQELSKHNKTKSEYNQSICVETSFIEPVIYYAKVIKQQKSPIKKTETMSSPPQLLKQLKPKDKVIPRQHFPSRNQLQPPSRYKNDVVEELVDDVLMLFRKRMQLQYDGIYERLLDERVMLHLIEH